MQTMLLALALIVVASSCSDGDFSGQSEKSEGKKEPKLAAEPEIEMDAKTDASSEVEEDEPFEEDEEAPEPKPKAKKTPPAKDDAPAVDLIQNGSFETQVVNSFLAEYFAGDSASLAHWKITTGSVHNCDTSVYQTAEGKYALDLDGNTGSKGGIAQTVATQKGKSYRLTFAVAANTNAAPVVKTFRVEANAQTHDVSFDSTGKGLQNMGYVENEWVFVADSASTEVRFISTTTGLPGWGAVIDHVRMFEVKK